LQRVADEMHAYSMFGRQLANAVNNALGETPIFPSTLGSAFPWPDKPLPPHTLTYTSTPRQEPTGHQGGSPQRG
jgi:hypothetical protein